MYKYGLLILLSTHVLGAESFELINAVKNGCSTIAINLIHSTKANIKIVDEMGNSALHYTVSYHLNEVTDQLLKQGVQPNIRNKQGETPVHIAVRVHNCHALQAMLDYHADINIQNMLGDTPMHIATQLSHSAPNRRIIKRLLAHNPDLSIQNNNLSSVTMLLEGKQSTAINSNHKRRENKNIRHAKLLVTNHQQIHKQPTQPDQPQTHCA